MYANLRECLNDLEKNNQLLRITQPVDANLEMAEIHRQVFDQGGPAVYFENVIGSPFPAVSNIYGTFERTEFIFRKTIEKVKKVIELKADPTLFLKNPWRYRTAPFTAMSALPFKSPFGLNVKYGETTIDKLPQVISWPDDGGGFITLPQVCTLPPDNNNIMQSNIGMYRIQMSGNEYDLNEEVGLHYQIHRGIGVHHTAYNQSDKPFRASIFVGGPPAHAFAAIMPLPEGLSEMTFAGMLAGRRFRYGLDNRAVISGDADFCITGTILKNHKKPEGPFGDHLGYYSLEHEFPVMKVDKVYHRKDAIWQFTAVGRPPAEDSSFGYLIHKLVGALLPGEFPGVRQINAVDASGVHPLLLAVGSERYMPFRDKKPEEILTQANRIIGSGQTSLAKFLFIAAEEKGIEINAHKIPAYFKHVLERVDWRRDLHFQTKTTMDTLDYSGTGWNAGSKLVVACCGDQLRTLSDRLPDRFDLPDGFDTPRFWQAGVLLINGPAFSDYKKAVSEMNQLTEFLEKSPLDQIPLIAIVDDADFSAATENNFLWTVFTRANPSHDTYGVDDFVQNKHWGCRGPLVIDARIKPHHAPVLIKNKKVERKVEELLGKVWKK